MQSSGQFVNINRYIKAYTHTCIQTYIHRHKSTYTHTYIYAYTLLHVPLKPAADALTVVVV